MAPSTFWLGHVTDQRDCRSALIGPRTASPRFFSGRTRKGMTPTETAKPRFENTLSALEETSDDEYLAAHTIDVQRSYTENLPHDLADEFTRRGARCGHRAR